MSGRGAVYNISAIELRNPETIDRRKRSPWQEVQEAPNKSGGCRSGPPRLGQGPGYYLCL